MPDAADVNAQHLAAMGVDPGSLSQPYATTEAGPSKDNEGRCPSRTADAFRCARREGHGGRHARGSMTWESEEPGPKWNEDDRKHCEDQVAHVSHRHGDEDWYCTGLGTNPHADPTKQREGDQALPKPGQQCVQDLVIAEMEESKRVGMERYGSTLQTFNARRSIQDVAEEVRDLHVYLTQVRAESETDRDTLVKVVLETMTAKDHMDDCGSGWREEFAEIAVDTIMGWVVGQTMGRHLERREIYQILDCEFMGVELDSDTVADVVERQTMVLVERLGIKRGES